MTGDGPGLGVAMVGHAFMGRVHSQAWRNVHHVFDLPVTPRMAVLVGHDRDRAGAAAQRLGWESAAADWREVLDRDDVHLVDICTPGDSHAEIALAALAAGKHVLCEKPLATTVEQAEAMAAAADRARDRGVRSMVGFSYRRVPALALARRLVDSGRIGLVRQVRASYLQDWLVDPQAPRVWRLERERAGSGALGDIGAHAVDLAQWVSGQRLTGVCGQLETFVRERPLPDGGTGPVTVDDAAIFHGRLMGGALASFVATRMAAGRRNSLRLEVDGSTGGLAFDLEAMNELQVYDATEDPVTAGFRRVLVSEAEHPWMSAWWPPGHLLGYEHTFVHQARDLLVAIAAGEDPVPSFADGLQVQRVLASVEGSAVGGGGWVGVDH